MHKTSVLRMEEAFMAEACDSENLETQIDKPKTSGSALATFPWFEALKFSLRVIRKSFFKLFIPAMALSFLFGALHALIADNAEFYWGHAPLFVNLFIVLLICIIALPIYAFLYPLLKRYVLFLGMQELCPHVLMDYKKIPRKIQFRCFPDLVAISLKRFFFQSLSFLPWFVFPLYLIWSPALFGPSNIVWAMGKAILISIVALLPVAWSFFAYFFAELHTIDKLIQEAKIHSVHPVNIFWSHELDETTQEENPDIIRNRKAIRPDKKLFWPILSWKALLLVTYIALLFALDYCYIRSGKAINFLDYASDSVLPMVIGVSPAFLFGFLFHPFFEPVLNAIFKNNFWDIWQYRNVSDFFIDNPNALWILLFFLLLFGLLTAFFFLVETLSSVYFYHRCRGNSGEELTEKNEASKETVCRKPVRNDLSI